MNSHEERTALKMLAELGYTFVGTNGAGEIRNAANEMIAVVDPLEVRAWVNGVRHGLSNRTSCIHEPEETLASAHAHTRELPSCPWCIIKRKDRELEALRSTLNRATSRNTRSLGNDPVLNRPRGAKRG